MADSSPQHLSNDMIFSEIEALFDWRGSICRESFFQDTKKQSVSSSAPSTLVVWCKHEVEKGTFDQALMERFAAAHVELSNAAKALLERAGTGETPTLRLYDDFENQCTAYLLHIRRLQQDVADAGAAVDSVTGLRTVSGMHADLKREQDRFDRKGTAFSVANIEIDNLEALKKEHDRRTIDFVYASISQMISRTIRSFDDAYYMGSGEFLLVLKHVEFDDACIVMDRMRADIEDTPIFLPESEKIMITASFGVAEAIPRDDAEKTLEHAKYALSNAREAGGNSVEAYEEVSALEKYKRDLQIDRS